MHTRERGAAHINIFFFLVVLVLLLGALGFGYAQLTENVDLQERIRTVAARNRQIEHDLLVYDHYVQDIGKLVGQPGTYEGREAYNYDLASGVTKKSIENAAAPAKVRALLGDFARGAGIPDTTAAPLDSLLQLTKSALDTKDKRITELQEQNGTLSNQLTQLQAAVSEANRLKATEVATLSEEKNELRQFIEAEFAKKEQTITGLRDEVKTKRDELDTEKQQRAAEAAGLNKERNTLKAQIDALAAKFALRNPPEQPDGTVLSSSQAASRAWIDLGRKDMLPRGIVFQITAPNSAKVKAYGRVSRVDYDRSEVELFDVADPFEPVVKGDLIRNDLYSANLRRNIYLMGRFGYPLPKETVKVILEQLGNTVVDKVGPGVDLVIVGGDALNEAGDGFSPITDSQEYKDALFLGVEIAPINKVREFLKLETE